MIKKLIRLIKKIIIKLLYSLIYSYPGYILYDFVQRLKGYKKERQRVYDKIGYYPNFKDPKSFNEKILWKKIYDRNPLLPIIADKYRVREYLKDVLGQKKAQEIIIPFLYVTDNPENIPFDSLSGEYIIKPNHASNKYIIVEDDGKQKKYAIRKGNIKSTVLTDCQETRNEIIKVCKGWLKMPHAFYMHEWAYQKIKRKIIIEKLLRDSNGKIPIDYKFTIFNGKCNYLTVWYDRFIDLKMGRYTPEWEYINIKGRTKLAEYKEKPKNLQSMINLAETLGKPFDYIRVDLYLVDDRIYFGELTNYSASGAIQLPKSIDFELGSKWKIVPKYWKKVNYGNI
jgi:hypothetical protein